MLKRVFKLIFIFFFCFYFIHPALADPAFYNIVPDHITSGTGQSGDITVSLYNDSNAKIGRVLLDISCNSGSYVFNCSIGNDSSEVTLAAGERETLTLEPGTEGVVLSINTDWSDYSYTATAMYIQVEAVTPEGYSQYLSNLFPETNDGVWETGQVMDLMYGI